LHHQSDQRGFVFEISCQEEVEAAFFVDLSAGDAAEEAAVRLRVDLLGLSTSCSTTSIISKQQFALGLAIVTMCFYGLCGVLMDCVVFLALDQIFGVW
jgi:hypothetical protein